MNRREFLTASVAAGTTTSATSMADAAGDRKAVKILGISCSPRKGKTTAAALAICLEAAKAVPGIATAKNLGRHVAQVALKLARAGS